MFSSPACVPNPVSLSFRSEESSPRAKGVAIGSTKTVTEKTLAANRLNAKRSTGPRTERGKNYSKFNAVKTGLFAEHVVIPKCDGGYYEDDDDPNEQFSQLMEALQQEYKPEGPSEVFLVAQLAECMWKQRRMSRSERGLVVARVGLYGESSDAVTPIEQLTYEHSVLEKAQKEIATARTLSPVTYADVLMALELVRTGFVKPRWLQIKDDSSPSEVKLDDQFVASLEEAKAKLERVFCFMMGKKKWSDHEAAHALPLEDDMDQLLRYDRALQKKFDWALQKLLESQQRRRKAQASRSVQVSNDQ